MPPEFSGKDTSCEKVHGCNIDMFLEKNLSCSAIRLLHTGCYQNFMKLQHAEKTWKLLRRQTG